MAVNRIKNVKQLRGQIKRRESVLVTNEIRQNVKVTVGYQHKHEFDVVACVLRY
jgi:hypothetical protein